MVWKTKRQILTRIVSQDPDELSHILTARMFEAAVRRLREGSDFSFDMTVSYFDFIFDGALPNGGVLTKAEGTGLQNYSLYVALNGAIEFQAGTGRVVASPGVAAFGEAPASSQHTYAEGTEFVFVGVDFADMHRHLSEQIDRPVTRPLDFAPNVPLDKGPGLAIMGVLGGLRAGLAGDAPLLRSPIAMQRMKDTMIALLLESVPHRFSQELGAPVSAVSPRYVKRATEFMWANASRPLSAADIAAACGVSSRALNSGFRRFKAMPMMAHLREIRLCAARQELRNPASAASIAEVAARWGFTHFGRFSSEYEKRFGELPSHTRRKIVGAGPSAF